MERFSLLTFLSLFIVYHSAIESVHSSPASQNNYTVTAGNITCVVMTTAVQLTIPYTSDNTTLTTTVNITSSYGTSGSCSNNLGKNTLNISFFDDSWNLVIIFKNTSDSSYEWSEVELTYVLDRMHFPNVSSVNENKTMQIDTILPASTKKAKLSGSYQCVGTSNLQLNSSVTLTLTDLQYRAFGNDNSSWFTGTNIQNCTAAELPVTPAVVTVTIGIIVGVSIVVVIVFYLVADKVMGRKKISYD